jgi:kinetochor protein Mis14/NSL1
VRAAKAYADALDKALEEDDDDDQEEFEEGPEDVLQRHPEWKLHVPFDTEQEASRWADGEMADVYSDALRTLVRLQPELGAAGDESMEEDAEGKSLGLAATVGKVERARKAAEVVARSATPGGGGM